MKLSTVPVTPMRKIKTLPVSSDQSKLDVAMRDQKVLFIFAQISKLLVEKCIDNKLEEISETEFVRICSVDSDLGTVVIKVYRAFIGSWSFLYERWSSGVFFTQTKPPTGPFWDNMNDSMFNTLESHTINPEEEAKRKRQAQEAANEELAARVAASVASKEWK